MILLLLIIYLVSDVQSQTCALKYPCPPPTWGPQWQLNLSTICQPSVPTYFEPPVDEPWGLVSLDWSNAESLWRNADPNKSTCEETNTQNAILIKKKSPRTRVFIYHNMELALQWLTSQRGIMYDRTKADFFLQYTNGQGKKNGTIYNEPVSQGDQYFWDFRTPGAAEAYIDGVVKLVSNSNVDGIFTDDVTGLPAEHPSAPMHMNLSSSEVNEIQIATQKVSQQLINKLISMGKYNWQAFSAQDGVGPAPTQNSCKQFMRNYCNPKMQNNPMTMQFSTTDKQQILAAFLISRSPYSWLGFGWESDMKNWDSIFNTDVGVPLGLCKEGPAGVFSRDWSKMKVSLNCDNWQASLEKIKS